MGKPCLHNHGLSQRSSQTTLHDRPQAICSIWFKVIGDHPTRGRENRAAMRVLPTHFGGSAERRMNTRRMDCSSRGRVTPKSGTPIRLASCRDRGSSSAIKAGRRAGESKDVGCHGIARSWLDGDALAGVKPKPPSWITRMLPFSKTWLCPAPRVV